MSKHTKRITLPITAFLISMLLCTCLGEEGTIHITIVSSPNTDLLAQIYRVRATLEGTTSSFEATRDDEGVLQASIDLLANGSSGNLLVEGFSQSDELLAIGNVGPLPRSAVDAEVVVFMAPPLSISQATVELIPARSRIGSVATSFGVLLVGGQTQDGVSSSIEGYSTYLHSLQQGPDMPSPRSRTAVATSSSGLVYLVGGDDDAGEATAQSYLFDTRQGAFFNLALADEYARTGASLAVVGQELFVVSGDPALLLDGSTGTATPLQEGQQCEGPAITLFTESNVQVLFAGAGVAGGAALYDQGLIRRLAAPTELSERSEHRGIRLASNQALFLGGSIDGQPTTSAVRYDPLLVSFQTIELLATPRNLPAVALTDRYLVVAGGEDINGQVITDVEIFDRSTLTLRAVLPLLVPRKHATAQPLGNGQVLIAGGEDAQGNAISVLELFTPDS